MNVLFVILVIDLAIGYGFTSDAVPDTTLRLPGLGTRAQKHQIVFSGVALHNMTLS